jgi:hypothetical protein
LNIISTISYLLNLAAFSSCPFGGTPSISPSALFFFGLAFLGGGEAS